MWGYTARDHATIPSLVAARLSSAGVHDVEVVNLAQPAFNLTKSLVTLTLRLREGDQPAVAVFLDGVNEIGPVNDGERPGGVWGQRKAQERFARSRRRGLLSAVGDLVGESQIVDWLSRLRDRDPELPPVNVERACETVSTNYRNLVRAGKALGNEFDVQTIFFWQPTLATTKKTLGSRERWLMGDGLAQRELRLIEMIRECSERVDQLMRASHDLSYFPLHHIYDDQKSDAFLDHYGHLTESANDLIAAEIVAQLLPLLQSQPRKAATTCRSGEQ